MRSLVGTTLKGQTKSISISEDAVTIIPRALYHGFIGEKRIPFSSITAIQFKEAGSWLAGFIQFSIKGGIEWRGQVNQDENALQFEREFNAEFSALREFVERQMAAISASPATSTADELMKLAALRDQGILTEEEFASQKTKLLR